MDVSVNEEQRAWQLKARKFAEEELRPISLKRDRYSDPRETFDGEIIKKGSKLGLRTAVVAKEWGGHGIDFVTQALVMAELARCESAIAKTFSHCWKCQRREGKGMATFLGQGTAPARKLSALYIGAAVVVLAGTITFSQAQPSTWRPERAVEMIVPAGPGGGIDGMTREIERILQNNRIVDVPVIVVNKAGGGQTIAMNYLDQHVGDGHYVLHSTMSLMTNHILGRSKVNYTDYTPLAILYSEYMTLVVRPDSPLKTGRDIQEKLKGDPKSISIAVGIAVGGTNHLTIALVTKAMGIDVKKLKTVVFQTAGDTKTAVMGGHVDLASMSIGNALRGMQEGGLRIIGITSDRRGEGSLAEIPTWKEQGFDVVFTNTRFTLGPRGMGPAQTAYWDAILARLVQTSEWKSYLQKGHFVSEYLESKQSPQRLEKIYKQLKGALADAGLVKE